MSAVEVRATERDHSSRICKTSGYDFRKLGLANFMESVDRTRCKAFGGIEEGLEDVANADFPIPGLAATTINWPCG